MLARAVLLASIIVVATAPAVKITDASGNAVTQLAGLLGLLNGFRMMRRPDPTPSGAAEMALA